MADTDVLSADENAFFENGGETDIPQTVTAEPVNDDKSLAEKPAAPETRETKPEEEAPKEQPLVPLGALHKERALRREIQAEMSALREESARRDAILEQRLQALYGAAEKKEVPSFEEDPANNLRAENELIKVKLKALDDFRVKQETERLEDMAKQAMADFLVENEKEFAELTPDYYEAATFFRERKLAEYMALGMSENQALATTQNQIYSIIKKAGEAGKNPAEMGYKAAVALGYQKKSASPENSGKIESLAKGIAASKSVGSGGEVKSNLTLDQIAAMSNEEFEKAMEGDNWRKMMGG